MMCEYIRKNDLLDEFCRDNCERKYDGTCGNCRMTEIIADFPAADVAPVVHGRFVHDGTRFAKGVDWWHCSSCGRLASGVETRFDYCPWCGARMDGDKE